MNTPIVIAEPSFQAAWAKVVLELSNNEWSIWNLVVQITNPSLFDLDIHCNIKRFCQCNDLIGPDQVAYTIFPYKLFHDGIDRDRLYRAYWRYFYSNHLANYSRWKGTYFERMIRYQPMGKTNQATDQLGTIIDSINKRSENYGKSYLIVIPYPNRDAKRIMGGPCLNYITVQVEGHPQTGLTINLLAVYRNHDFLKRAYGNYLGLCKLLQYIASETNSTPGCITCISSHAYVDNKKTVLKKLSLSVLENHNDA